MKEIHRHVDDITCLQLKIFVLGYYPMGESLLILICDEINKEVLMSILVDCYSQGKNNRMYDVLNKYGIKDKKLNFVIWTHPDKDHSIGLKELLKDYSSQNTLVILPDGASKRLFNLKRLGILKTWLAIKKEGIFHNLQVERASSSSYTLFPTIYGQTYFEDGIHDSVPFNIEITTPFSNKVFEKTEKQNSHKGNDVSLSIKLNFNKHSFFLGGDAENEALNMIEPESWENVQFVKIPHHASTTSDALPDLLTSYSVHGSNGEITSISTSFKSDKASLPDNNILSKYKSSCKSILLTEGNNHRCKYGIWECDYSIVPYNEFKPIPAGDATVWYENIIKNY